MVKAQTSLDKVVVTADGEGVVSHAGSALLVALADKGWADRGAVGGDGADASARVGA